MFLRPFLPHPLVNSTQMRVLLVEDEPAVRDAALNALFDRAIEEVKSTFGKSYPLIINGREVKASSELDDRSPIDTRIQPIAIRDVLRLPRLEVPAPAAAVP